MTLLLDILRHAFIALCVGVVLQLAALLGGFWWRIGAELAADRPLAAHAVEAM